MALLISPGTRVIDVNGNLISGGKVRVYDQNTTNYTDLFSDAALTVPLPNPVIANSGGWPSSNPTTPTLIFAEAGAYDISFLDEDDNVLATFEDSPSFGEEDGELSRTVTGNGRFLVTGSAGAVLMQVGDPSPDNSGGTLVIEGWGGTQGDSVTVDAALFDTTGRIKENGKKLMGVVGTPAATVTAGASIPIELTNDPTGVTMWEINVWNLSVSGTDDVVLQLSFDGGSTWKTTALDYNWTRIFWGTTTALTSGSGTSGASSANILLFNGGTAVANQPASAFIRVGTPDSGSNYTRVAWDVTGVNTTEHFVAMGRGKSATAQGRATHIRIDTTGTNTLTGTYRVIPLRGTGET